MLCLTCLKLKDVRCLRYRPDETVKTAIEQMEELSAGTSIVMDGDNVAGIISERDVIRKVVLQGKDIADVQVKDIMSSKLTTVTPETPLDECMKLITDQRIRHLPVMCGDKLCGIISIGDVVKYLIVEKDFKIKNLETYISGAM